MSRRRVPFGLAAPVALVLLVVALGALQYRWVGQVSEAERDQMRQSLDRRAREFGADFDREIASVWRAFRSDPAALARDPQRFARAYHEWKAASAFPDLVRESYVVGPDQTIERWDANAGAFTAVEWPESLARVRKQLASGPAPPAATPAGTRILAFSATPVMPEIPAIVITDALRELPIGPSSTLEVRVAETLMKPAPRSALVLVLDEEYIGLTVLPALAERHFPESGVDRYRVSVVDSSGAAVMTRGLSAGATIAPPEADAISVFFNGITEIVRGVLNASPTGAAATIDWTAERQTTGASGAHASAGAVRITRPEAPPGRLSMVVEQAATMASSTLRASASGGWTLRLQHRAGSLAAAVERARQRNLMLSFGILGVLVASVGLVMVNARRAERLAAQQMDFVATVSHELRTPVAVIRSAAQNLSAGIVQDPAQAKRYGDVIETEGRRLTDMVEQVLEYAGLSGRGRPPVSRPVDAGAIAREVVETALSTTAAHLTFDVTVESTAPAVLIDPDALRRALQNLLGNAIKHAGEGGWVGVTVARGTDADAGRVRVSVADRGPGIATDDLPHIFEPFYRGRHAVDGQVQGNGLGLSLVKRIAEAHGGRVDVASAQGEGATFTMVLPAASGAAAAVGADATAMTLDRPAHPAGRGSH